MGLGRGGTFIEKKRTSRDPRIISRQISLLTPLINPHRSGFFPLRRALSSFRQKKPVRRCLDNTLDILSNKPGQSSKF